MTPNSNTACLAYAPMQFTKWLIVSAAICLLSSCAETEETAKKAPKKEAPGNPSKAEDGTNEAPGNAAFDFIKSTLEEISLGTSREEVRKRPGFDHDEEMDLSAAKQHGVSVFVHYDKDGSVVSMQVQDLDHSHEGVLPFLKEKFGEPADKTQKGVTVYRKEGSFRVKCQLAGDKMTNIDIRGEAAIPPWEK